MGSVVLVSPDVDRWEEFAQALRKQIKVDIIKVRTGRQALETARTVNPLAMAIDVSLDDMSGTELIKQLLGINAMINTALASDQPEEIFHEQTEGLGILMKLSLKPNPAEAGRLAECLRQVTGAV